MDIRTEIRKVLKSSLGLKMQNDSEYLSDFDLKDEVRQEDKTTVIFRKIEKRAGKEEQAAIEVRIEKMSDNFWHLHLSIGGPQGQKGGTTIKTNEGYDKFIELIDNKFKNNPIFDTYNFKDDNDEIMGDELMKMLEYLTKYSKEVESIESSDFIPIRKILKVIKRFPDIKKHRQRIIEKLLTMFNDEQEIILHLSKLPQIKFKKKVDDFYSTSPRTSFPNPE